MGESLSLVLYFEMNKQTVIQPKFLSLFWMWEYSYFTLQTSNTQYCIFDVLRTVYQYSFPYLLKSGVGAPVTAAPLCFLQISLSTLHLKRAPRHFLRIKRHWHVNNSK